MSIPRTVADVIRQHVTLEIEGIDRLYLNAYQPKLQHACGVVLPPWQRGHPGGTNTVARQALFFAAVAANPAQVFNSLWLTLYVARTHGLRHGRCFSLFGHVWR
jgi:hypothetical protein